MNIESLDEYEGLTADMVRAWLAANGWTLQDGGALWCKLGCPGVGASFPDEVLVSCIAYAEQRSPQEILREMNPRMSDLSPDRQGAIMSTPSRARELAIAIGGRELTHEEDDEIAGYLERLAAIDEASGEVAEIEARVASVRALPWPPHGEGFLVDIVALLAIVKRQAGELAAARAKVARLTGELGDLRSAATRVVGHFVDVGTRGYQLCDSSILRPCLDVLRAAIAKARP